MTPETPVAARRAVMLHRPLAPVAAVSVLGEFSDTAHDSLPSHERSHSKGIFVFFETLRVFLFCKGYESKSKNPTEENMKLCNSSPITVYARLNRDAHQKSACPPTMSSPRLELDSSYPRPSSNILVQ